MPAVQDGTPSFSYHSVGSTIVPSLCQSEESIGLQSLTI